MATELKRFTISVTPSMEVELNHVKKERYYNVTQNGMIRDLIVRGLKSLEEQNGYESRCTASERLKRLGPERV